MSISDKELADAVVALGVVHINWDRYFVGEVFLCDTDKPYAAKKITTDPRVAMALMEIMAIEPSRVFKRGGVAGLVIAIGNADLMRMSSVLVDADESLPRAITEACVEALR